MPDHAGMFGLHMAMSLLPGVLAMAVALWADRLWGEPPAWAHPVVAMGRYLSVWTDRLCALPTAPARLGGVLAWWLGAMLVLAFGLLLEIGVGMGLSVWLRDDAGLPAASGWLIYLLGKGVLTGLLLKPTLAARMLFDEVHAVEAALATSLRAGRVRLSRLVSRDVSSLGEAEVREAAIETLAENLNDSVVAPLFWFVLAGLPGAWLYRYANTADAMWGYRDHREAMGWWAARSDDWLSWLPARLTALALCAAAWRWPGWPRMADEAARTPSPNGGWPMGTLAVLLGVCLSKPGVYTLNPAGRSVQPEDVPQALTWSRQTVGMVVASLTLAWLMVALLAAVGTMSGAQHA
jgi:adenosylcobinamide-phosphate synthase